MPCDLAAFAVTARTALIGGLSSELRVTVSRWIIETEDMCHFGATTASSYFL